MTDPNYEARLKEIKRNIYLEGDFRQHKQNYDQDVMIEVAWALNTPEEQGVSLSLALADIYHLPTEDLTELLHIATDKVVERVAEQIIRAQDIAAG